MRRAQPLLALFILGLVLLGSILFRAFVVEVEAARVACTAAAPPLWCVPRDALLFGQHHEIFGLLSLALGILALLTGGRFTGLAAVAIGLVALTNYNVGLGAVGLVLGLVGSVRGWLRPAPDGGRARRPTESSATREGG